MGNLLIAIATNTGIIILFCLVLIFGLISPIIYLIKIRKENNLDSLERKLMARIIAIRRNCEDAMRQCSEYPQLIVDDPLVVSDADRFLDILAKEQGVVIDR